MKRKYFNLWINSLPVLEHNRGACWLIVWLKRSAAA
jgi:hypothetical protein